jgi:hypothetical protein
VHLLSLAQRLSVCWGHTRRHPCVEEEETEEDAVYDAHRARRHGEVVGDRHQSTRTTTQTRMAAKQMQDGGSEVDTEE